MAFTGYSIRCLVLITTEKPRVVGAPKPAKAWTETVSYRAQRGQFEELASLRRSNPGALSRLVTIDVQVALPFREAILLRARGANVPFVSLPDCSSEVRRPGCFRDGQSAPRAAHPGSG